MLDRMLLIRLVFVAPALWVLESHPAIGQASDPTAMDLESLLGTSISSASKYEQDQSSAPAAVNVLTREDIRAFGWRTLIEALASLPGIHSTYDRQYHYLGVRGFGLPGDFNTRVLLAINGNRVNDVVYDGAQVGREFPLDMSLVERIEYFMGPGGAVYGQNAMIAVVNVITRTGFQVDGAELQLLGAEPQDQHELGWRWGRRLENDTELLLSLSTMRAKGENLIMNFPGQAPDGGELLGEAIGLDAERDQELFAQATKGAWSYDLIYGKRQKEDPTGSYYSDPFTVGQYSRDSYFISQLRYSQLYADGDLDLQGRLFLGRQRYRGTSAYSGIRYFSNGYSDWRGGELRFLYNAFDGHTLMFGVEGQDNSRADQNYYDEQAGGDDLEIPASGHRVGLYLQDEWRFREGWQATLGARLDHNNITDDKLSPRAALIWQAGVATSIKALYGRAWRAPNQYEAL
jgi:iron complex outermembrane receptor protein